MLRYTNYNVVFQEIPGEVTLAINISNCPNRCKGCHSPYLWDDVGDPLDDEAIGFFLEKYGRAITCLAFMGGDAEPQEVTRLAERVHSRTQGTVKTAWYSGKTTFTGGALRHFDYVKLGPYREELGGLRSPSTNQRLYKITGEEMIDITHLFRNS